MKSIRRTLSVVIVITIVWLSGSNQFIYATDTVETPNIPETEEIICTFCDDDELTLKEKCQELIVKALIDEDNILADGIITKEVYILQCQPFQEALHKLENATEEEVLEEYKWILLYHCDELCEEEAAGMEVDQEFHNYIMQEIEQYGVEL